MASSTPAISHALEDSQDADDNLPQPVWPFNKVPLEVFEIITSNLCRSDVKSMRLVCKEFEAKIVPCLFRSVRVPFRSNLYRDLAAGCDDATTLASSPWIFCRGLGIFRTFGRFIRQFALSFDLDETVLAYPPSKPDQIVIAGFWGLYRWPPETYRRYEDLWGLERHADEMEGMRCALSYLSYVSSLGLRCAGGLGFLRLIESTNRADKFPRRAVLHTVGASRPRKKRKSPSSAIRTLHNFDGGCRDVDTTFTRVEGYNRKMLAEMLHESGYSQYELSEAADILLDTESKTLLDLDFDERRWGVEFWEQLPNPSPLIQDIVARARSLREVGIKHDPDLIEMAREPLIPSSLTRQQKELLVELAWAQSAMIQSYVMGIMDNAVVGSFHCLTTLSFSWLPSCHLTELCRKDFWDRLVTLVNVSLGVIADWRRLTKPIWGTIVDQPVSPADAVPIAFSLLHDFIGKQRNIKKVHFEWICGGEFAAGPYQRNQFVVPAPFVRETASMVLPLVVVQSDEELLELPHVRHLSLKNCWASPQVLIQTIRSMALSSLQELELESVSLSGPPTLERQAAIPTPNMVAPGPLIFTLNGPFDAVVINIDPVTPPSLLPGWPNIPGNIPPVLSWAGFMDLFTQGTKLRDAVSSKYVLPQPDDSLAWTARMDLAAKFLPDVDLLESEAAVYKLESILFKSCGHVLVDAPFIDSRSIASLRASPVLIARHDPLGIMQNCHDRLLTLILPHFKHVQSLFLETVHGMRFGWKSIYADHVKQEAGIDGFPSQGSNFNQQS
ncbi:hypothetical protein ESCO_006387 [Escovopsis weberi]|uniref:F-box domain-containing protein n=1 Tax=Escovopsis weberi TaxID=150374 RepID=A0A0M8N068_ESCWE|nr:hypothetical protein ESCO_006387 [Escovopsis weberi]